MPRKDTLHYWPDRIAERNHRNLKLTCAECERELRKLYKRQSDILYQHIMETWLKMERDSETRGKVYLNDLYRTNTYHELYQHFYNCCMALGQEQEAITERSLIKAYEEAKATVERYVPKSAIRQHFSIPSAIDATQAVHHVWCLDGKEFSDRIWADKKSLVSDLMNTMADYVARGESAFEIARGITQRLKVNIFCAYRLARTETAHIQVVGQAEKYKEMGFTHAIYLANDPCSECAAYDGQRFTLDEIQGLIPKHPNCTCSFLIDVEV